MDIMFIAAYAPGDHLPRATRQKFWSTLSTEIRKAPHRTVIIVGTDANGHVGRDPSGGIGPANPEYWSENGVQLQTRWHHAGTQVGYGKKGTPQQRVESTTYYCLPAGSTKSSSTKELNSGLRFTNKALQLITGRSQSPSS